MTTQPSPSAAVRSPRIIDQNGPAPLSWPAKAVAVADHDGVPHWWCNDCQAWHPITCPNGEDR